MRILTRRVFTVSTDLYAGALSRCSRGGWSPFPLFINCILSYVCDMNCPFCVASPGRLNTKYPHLQAAAWNRIFQQIASTALLGFSGGEIFCHPEMFEILRYAIRNHRIVVVTNGISFDDKTIPLFIEMGADRIWNNGLVQIGISINEPIRSEQECRAILDEKIRLFDRLAIEREKQGKRFPRLELKVLIREETAPYLELFGLALKRNSVDSVTFQMLTSQIFCSYLGLDPNDERRITSLREYRYEEAERINFSAITELRESFARLSMLPRSIRDRISFLPPLGREDFLAYYDGRFEIARFHCTNPWMHMMIDPNGVAYHCINPEGVDLKRVAFAKAWNDPRFRAFRREVRDQRIFNRCTGCCFLRP